MCKEDFLLKDESGDKKYFTVLPNYIANHSTGIDQALYFQMKRYAGEHGECFCSEKTLMGKLKIGRLRFKKALNYLLEKEWIIETDKREINTKGGKQFIQCYKINDLWKMFMEHYERGVDLTTPRGVEMERGVDLNTQGVAKSTQRGVDLADKEEPLKKNHIKKNLSGDVKKFLTYFGEVWKQEVGNGSNYYCNFGKDGKLVKQLLCVYTYEELSALAEKFFHFDDDWVRDKGYTIGIFKSQIPKLITGTMSKKSNYEKAMDFADELKEVRENARA